MLLSVARKVLAIPVVFNLYQSLIGAPRCHQYFIRDHVRPRTGDTILDVGCGTGASIKLLPHPVTYTGIDISDSYIGHAQAKYGSLGRFVVGDVTRPGEDLSGPYDLAFAFGVLHHLSDDQVAGLVSNLLAALRPGGRFVSIDPCLVDPQHPVARFLIKNDRGQFVRTPAQLKSLFGDGFVGSHHVVHHMLRVPYTQVVLELARPAAD